MGSESVKKAQTVLGLVNGEDLGITQMHEHLIVDARQTFVEPADLRERQLAHQPMSLENAREIFYMPRSNYDAMAYLDEEKAINEALSYRLLGGNTIVDCTSRDLGRDPDALVRISKATGLNVIMGAGYYFKAGGVIGGAYKFKTVSDSKTAERSEDEIADEIVQEITEGIGPNKVRTGTIGEIAISYPMQPNQKKILRAAAKAQRLTGAPTNIHPGYSESSALEIISVLSDAGADMSRTIMCHIDISVRQESTRRELAKTGCYLEYDHLGREEYYSLDKAWTTDLPDDLRRIDEIMQLVSWGYLNQILLSTDVGNKSSRSSYGGVGMEHLLRRFVPLMRRRGVSEDVIHTILVENPKRVLCFV